jgi:transcriptional regulator with XRE-family HTH domain
MRRWDQADLAKRIDFSTAIVSQIERGRLKPSPEQVERLAHAFGYSTEFLTAEIGLSEASRPLLRAYADASKRESDARIATCVTAVEAIRALGIRPIPDLSPSIGDVDPDDSDALEDVAQELRTAAQVDEGAVVTNMIRAAERVGCFVMPFESELGRHIGMSLRTGDSETILRTVRSVLLLPLTHLRHGWHQNFYFN